MHSATGFQALNICVLAISDTRTQETDKSGQKLADLLADAGHRLYDRQLVRDDIYQIRAVVSRWISDPAAQVVLTTGGTGFASRDVTPEAITVLLDRPIDGFGELFRQISYQEIGTSTIQSRAFAGMANGTGIFCLPGSTGACATAWVHILKDQLDARHKPCNFAQQLSTPAL